MLGDTTSEQSAMQQVIGKLIGHATGALMVSIIRYMLGNIRTRDETAYRLKNTELIHMLKSISATTGVTIRYIANS